MKKLLAGLLFACLSFTPALAVNKNISDLPSATSVTGTSNLFECEQSGTNNQCTSVQIAAYIYGLMSGDATASGTGAVTFATVNSNVGTFGSATQCTVATVNAKGLITAVSQVTCTPAMSSVTGRAALSQLPQGIANSIWINPTGSTADMQNVAVPACANDGAHALVYVNGTGLQCASITGSGVSFANPTATAGPTANNGSSTSAMRADASPAIQLGTGSAPGLVQCGLGLTCTGGVANGGVTDSAVATTTYTLVNGDGGVVKRFTGTAATITVPTPSGFSSNYDVTLKCETTVSACTTSGTIDGSATAITIPIGSSIDLYVDGSSNWHKLPGNIPTLGTAATANTGTSGATLPLLNGNNTFSGNNSHSGTETFTSVIGTINTQSGTTYTLAASDCGKTVLITNASAITLTTLNSIPAGCAIAVEQGGAGQITVANGSGATLTSAHSYTKTFNAAGAIIGLFVDTNSGTNAHYVLTGDGA